MSVAEPDVTNTAPSRSRAETRRRLVEAGTRLFAAEGLHAVTSAQIARAAGVATGTFYLHFKDKQALFHEIVFGALRELRARQDAAAGEVASGSVAEMRARTEELLVFAEENRDLILVLFGRGGESATVGEDVLDEILPGVQRRLEERHARGEIPAGVCPPVAAQAIGGMTARVIAWWVENPKSATRAQVVDTLLAMHPASHLQAADNTNP